MAVVLLILVVVAAVTLVLAGGGRDDEDDDGVSAVICRRSNPSRALPSPCESPGHFYLIVFDDEEASLSLFVTSRV